MQRKAKYMKKLDRTRLSAAIEARAASDLSLCNIGGAAALVAQDGEILYENYFGESESFFGAPAPDTLYRLASMTKPITAVATMILVDRGLLSLEDRVETFYPAFSSMKVQLADGTLADNAVPITLRHLLTHSSGIGSGTVWSELVSRITEREREGVEAFVELLSESPLSFVPGTQSEYSAIGAFSVLTGIIQKVTGLPYEEFLKRELFEPCRMVDTTFSPTKEQWGRLITMHDKVDGRHAVGQTVEGCVFETFSPESYLGGAGLISSMPDYANFARMLLNGGVFEGRRVLSVEAVAELSRPQVAKRGHEKWGLGVRVATEPENTLPLGAYGWSGAYGTHFWVDPANRIFAVYMKNCRYDGGSGAVTSKNFEVDVYGSLSEV